MRTNAGFIAAIAALILAGGLGLYRCGREPMRERDVAAATKDSSDDSPAALPSKTEDRRSSKVRTREETEAILAKIKFNLDDIRPDGLRGPDDGLVSVSYEFCVPKEEAAYAEVRRIAPGVAIHAGSRGRIGCSEDQALCIGSTHGPAWRKELMGLAELGYVVQIAECHFE
jgi:hypothetical protein